MRDFVGSDMGFANLLDYPQKAFNTIKLILLWAGLTLFKSHLRKGQFAPHPFQDPTTDHPYTKINRSQSQLSINPISQSK